MTTDLATIAGLMSDEAADLSANKAASMFCAIATRMLLVYPPMYTECLYLTDSKTWLPIPSDLIPVAEVPLELSDRISNLVVRKINTFKDGSHSHFVLAHVDGILLVVVRAGLVHWLKECRDVSAKKAPGVISRAIRRFMRLHLEMPLPSAKIAPPLHAMDVYMALAGSSVGRSRTLGLRSCDCCGKVEGERQRLRKCGGCTRSYYCGRDCQRTDWNRRHRRACTLMCSLDTYVLTSIPDFARFLSLCKPQLREHTTFLVTEQSRGDLDRLRVILDSLGRGSKIVEMR